MNEEAPWSDEPIGTSPATALAAGLVGQFADRRSARGEQLRRAELIARQLSGRHPKDGWSEAYLDDLIVKLAPFVPGLRYRDGWFLFSRPVKDFSLQGSGPRRGRKPNWSDQRELLLLEEVEWLKSDPGRSVQSDSEAIKVVRRLSPNLCMNGDQSVGDKALKTHLSNARKRIAPFLAEFNSSIRNHFSSARGPDWSALSPGRQNALTVVVLIEWRLSPAYDTLAAFMAQKIASR